MPDAHKIYDQADALKEEGKLEEAIAKYQEAVAADPSYALAHSAMAVVYGRLGKHEEAVKHAQRACEINPNDPFSFTSMSVIYQRAYAGTGDPSYIQLAEEAMARSHMLQG
jgi:tetratricopeptide (TPR) repeat protein